jgi:hypothetical protein
LEYSFHGSLMLSAIIIPYPSISDHLPMSVL